MTLYKLPDYSDVPDPSDADLAEIDMALYEADLSSPPDAECVSAWYRSGAIQAALAAAGDSDGSDEWFCDFTTNVIGYMDDHDKPDPELVELVELWDHNVARWHGQLTYVGREIPRELLLRTDMTVAACAKLLDITEEQLLALLFPADYHDRLRAAAAEFRATPKGAMRAIAPRHGLYERMLSDWFKLVERVDPTTIGMEWLPICRELWRSGLRRGPLTAEAKRRGLFPTYMSDAQFYQRVRRNCPELPAALTTV